MVETEKFVQAILAIPIAIWMITAKFQSKRIPIPWTENTLVIHNQPPPHEFWIAVVMGVVIVFLSGQFYQHNGGIE